MIGFFMALLRSVSAPASDGVLDEATIERTVEQLLPQVRRQLFRALGSSPDLDDATQDALIEIARSLPRFNGTSSIDTWAYRITTRVAYRYYRNRRAPGTMVEEAVDLRSLGADPESRATHRQSVQRFQRCLDRLTPKRRVAFLLCAVERLPHAEAAEVEGVSVSTLRARLKRARKELKELMKQDPVLATFVGEEP